MKQHGRIVQLRRGRHGSCAENDKAVGVVKKSNPREHGYPRARTGADHEVQSMTMVSSQDKRCRQVTRGRKSNSFEQHAEGLRRQQRGNDRQAHRIRE